MTGKLKGVDKIFFHLSAIFGVNFARCYGHDKKHWEDICGSLSNEQIERGIIKCKKKYIEGEIPPSLWEFYKYCRDIKIDES